MNYTISTKISFIMIAGSLALATLFSCSSSNKTKNSIAETFVASAKLYATENNTQNVGEADFYSLPDGQIKMALVLNIPSKAGSSVAVHFHEHGDCGNMGNNAHGHWNPTKENHGKWGSASYHSGDIGNIFLNAKGYGKVGIITNRWSVSNTSSNNIIGLGIIVHGDTDDYKTQPTGNSGPRIGCGVIVPQ
jgi:superoxide dismutase, Cu-Zn family